MRLFHHLDRKFSLLLAAAFLLGGRAAGNAIPEDVVHKTFDLGPTARVSIRNTDGRIMIYGANAPRLEIWAMRRAFSKERMEAIEISVKIEGDAAVIDTIYPPPPHSRLGDRSGTVDYLILVPQTCTLPEVKLARGEVLIEGMRGLRIEVQVETGVLQVRNCFSVSDVTVGRGRLEIFQGWWETRAFSLSAEVANGDLQVGLPAAAALHLSAETPDGHVLGAFGPESIAADARTIDATIGAGGPVEFKLRTNHGNIKIKSAD